MTDVCLRDDFCDQPPGHIGDCVPLFETEYREGVFSVVEWAVAYQREVLRRVNGTPMDPSTVEQAGLPL